ncbi:MAG TPA: succinate dehydrogenase, hydrophobic membrane anchor protein, partial [Alphaproteobacteria bacterium]|nr:succinate dehydrogenase, hydrophobic membrane anchor protein [Alphaproteobacteria bacterium]
KEGVHHWWLQRVLSLALLPLSLWFVASVVGLAGADYATAVEWLANPVVAVLMVILIAIGFHHAQLGMQSVYEDYISRHWVRAGVDLATKGLCLVLAVAAIFAVLKIALGA